MRKNPSLVPGQNGKKRPLVSAPRPRDPVPGMISRMMCANTGSALCDSGQIYGYRYEENRKNPPAKQPAVALKFTIWPQNDLQNPAHDWEMDVRINTWHFLTRTLSAAPELNRSFQAFARRAAVRDECWLSIMEIWRAEMGFERVCIENTYNLDNVLSQDFQYLHFQTGDGRDYVILHTHNGCDIRGGYPRPSVFEVAESSFWDVGAYAVFIPDGGGMCWAYDLPGHLADGPESQRVQHLLDLGADLGDLEDWAGRHLTQDDVLHIPPLSDFQASPDPAAKGTGLIYIDENGDGHCPLTGRKLAADFF